VAELTEAAESAGGGIRVTMQAKAARGGKIYQAGRDQYITER
jgi:hypothetical protein